jgi:GNAT superfamily N-acetyltransferase
VSKSLSCRLEPLTLEQVDFVVSLHLNAFPNFFLSCLGPRFLREFYVSFLMDPVAMAFVGHDERDEVVGAIVGPLDPRGFFSRLLRRRWWAFCRASLATALSRPSTVPRLVRALTYRGDLPEGPVRALLSSVAVSPSAQGRGVGKALVLRWLEEARRRGASGCYLTTDADNNDAVNRFYRSMGWKLESAYTTPQGRKMNRYVYDFDRGLEKFAAKGEGVVAEASGCNPVGVEDRADRNPG